MTRVPVLIKRVPRWMLFWTYGMVPAKRTIWLRRDLTISVAALAHELAHVTQAEQHPWPLAYVTQWALTGFDYHTMPFEAEARRASREPFYRAWATDLLGPNAHP